MTSGRDNRLIVALDVPDREQAMALVDTLKATGCWFKVGLELFVALGPGFVRELTQQGHRIMLDLKLHDIPATVASATTCAAKVGAEMLTIHTAGGAEMMTAAVKAAHAASSTRRLRILGVTVLTSLADDDLAADGFSESAQDLVLRRARLAIASGCAGIVASSQELVALRRVVPAETLIVTPGIRPTGSEPGDQKRVATPAQAAAAGASFIVVGRPIRCAEDPESVARAIVAELDE